MAAVTRPGLRWRVSGRSRLRPYTTGRPLSSAARLELTAAPYYAWANREEGSMRAWIPAARWPGSVHGGGTAPGGCGPAGHGVDSK
ncbi:hypothetical protein [Streptomyces sp. BE230]|uniref:hypothetical protein n=1 Tax=Streptomyces sp. BE230 TaxID=3002526 RepID=UPI002ED468EE|nr:hypothetical protein [Streptomyces sp. BE230]